MSHSTNSNPLKDWSGNAVSALQQAAAVIKFDDIVIVWALDINEYPLYLKYT